MKALQIFTYNDTQIDFQSIDGELYANATAMCSAFGKRCADWLRLPQTIRYSEAILSKCENLTSLVLSNKGGIYAGGQTWIHQKLILKLAQWLDVDFEIWCDECVARFLNGEQKPTLPQNYKEAILALYLEIDERERLQKEVDELKPKAEYAIQVLQSISELTTSVIAKDLSMTAIALNKRLHALGIQFKQSGQWMLYAKFDKDGLATTRTYQYFDKKGNSKTKHYLVWTEVGRKFINDKIRPKNTAKQSLAIPYQSATA